MNWCSILFIFASYVSMIQATCLIPIKFYVDCTSARTFSDAISLCSSHQMTLLNLTNGTTLNSDIALLNSTFAAQNCSGYFWFSSGSQTGLVSSTNNLDNLLTGILTNTLNTILCLIPLLCPGTTTTAAPIAYAATVCTRTIQQGMILKCSTTSTRTDIVQNKFAKQNLYGGLLTTTSSKTTIQCTAACSLHSSCVGVILANETCSLYL